jgi:hypothetical protein
MPEVSRFYGIVITLYINEHNPPHFHVKYAEYVAEIDIQTLKIISGNLPKRAYALVLEWAVEHRDDLMENWNLAREQKNLKKINPLD